MDLPLWRSTAKTGSPIQDLYPTAVSVSVETIQDPYFEAGLTFGSDRQPTTDDRKRHHRYRREISRLCFELCTSNYGLRTDQRLDRGFELFELEGFGEDDVYVLVDLAGLGVAGEQHDGEVGVAAA